ncbi:MAG: type I methionyl aminopeptidase [Planctomycetes bacterium]|nr:type I methionyl aminopeptidase [Planctomycetota bacterium]
MGKTAGKFGVNDPCWCGSGRKYKRCHLSSDQVGTAAIGAPRAAQATIERRAPIRPGIVSPRRAVPEGIARPEYADTGRPEESQEFCYVRSREEIARLRRACRAAREVLELTKREVAAGVRTDALDAIAHEACIARGGYPSPLNYMGYPKSICTSVNEVICHGIPDSRPLEDGDIVNIDVTVYLDGMHGDVSETVLVGNVAPEHRKLVDVTRECLALGISRVRPGAPLSDIGGAIERHATSFGFSVVREFVGHGIGERFHMGPQVPHYFDREITTKLRSGMVFTLEPMINEGTWRHVLWDDRWTAVTADLGRSAQFEHTLVVTDDGVEVLTLAAANGTDAAQ